jgi:sugar phosphate isomerase/epimerase
VRRFTLGLPALVLFLLARAIAFAAPAPVSAPTPELFDRANLVAWCIVPFDAQKRGPAERAAMLVRLGFTQFAYDYRAEHIPTFDAELTALKRHGIRLTAWWFPRTLNDEARLILAVLKRHDLRGVQLWVTGAGAPTKSPAEQAARLAAEAARLRPIAEAAAEIGATVALYNHGAWFGEPENQVAVITHLRAAGVTNVGLVYNLHHGHDHVARFPALLALMKPHLLALNLNGTVPDGDKRGQKIVPLAQGELDASLLTAIRDSGWRGPIGILNHTDEDAEARLRDNLAGLDWLRQKISGQPTGERPVPLTWRAPKT